MSDNDKQEIIETPQVGTIVQFFVGGNPESEPRPALVVKSGREGQVMLLLFPGPAGGEMQGSGRWFRNLNDPWVKSHLDQLRKAQHGMPQGAWDWIPGTRKSAFVLPADVASEDTTVTAPRPTETAVNHSPEEDGPTQEEYTATRRAEGLAKARQLLEEGILSPDEIYPKVRLFGIKRPDFDSLVQATREALVGSNSNT